jgi:hypothetical protein
MVLIPQMPRQILAQQDNLYSKAPSPVSAGWQTGADPANAAPDSCAAEQSRSWDIAAGCQWTAAAAAVAAAPLPRDFPTSPRSGWHEAAAAHTAAVDCSCHWHPCLLLVAPHVPRRRGRETGLCLSPLAWLLHLPTPPGWWLDGFDEVQGEPVECSCCCPSKCYKTIRAFFVANKYCGPLLRSERKCCGSFWLNPVPERILTCFDD